MIRHALALTWSSMTARMGTVMLTAASLLISVALVLAVNQLRSDTRAGFSRTLAGADLVVGARSGDLNLLLYSIFRIGAPLNNMSWRSYSEIRDDPAVAWTIPISLGDSYRGYRIVGTSIAYFDHYRYAERQPLHLSQGRAFANPNEAVAGADVARDLGLELDARLIMAHGIGATSFQQHTQQPLRLVGILGRTGTPVDQAIHVSLEAIDQVHGIGPRIDDEPGDDHAEDNTEEHADQHAEDHEDDADDHAENAHSHGATETSSQRSLTAAIVGLKSRNSVLQVQRKINQSDHEPLSAIIPGLTLRSLWQVVGGVEKVFLTTGLLVIVAGLLGLLATLFIALGQRSREMAILRAVGASPAFIATLLVVEAVITSLLASVAGVALVGALRYWGRDYVLERYGLYLGHSETLHFSITLVGAVVGVAALLALLPAIMAYHRSLNDGLRIKT